MNEMVKYNNYMNSLTLGGLQSRELNILMALCNQFKEQGTNELQFTFAELRQLIDDHQSTNEQLFSALKTINRKLLDIVCEIETEEELVQFVLFTDFRTNRKFDYYKVGVNEKFSFILNELSSNFTVFELQEFVNLKSKYSKNLYRLLKQFDSSNSSWRKFEANDLREKLGCPKSYQNKIFVRDILNPCVEELKAIFNDLTLDINRARTKGRAITGYEFRWKQAVNDELPGQISFTTLKDFNEIVEGLKDSEKQEALKIAKDIIKGKAKSKEKGKPKPKHNFEGRKYVFDETGNNLIGEEKDGR